MIQQEYKKIYVRTSGEEVCLRIEDDDSYGDGMLNLCWLTERETQRLIEHLQKAKEKLEKKRLRMEELLRTVYIPGLYTEFERKYNPYPVEMSPAEAFGKALADGLIDQDTYDVAHQYYKKLWCYVGD